MSQRQGAEFWRKHLEAWSHSELTQVGYCAAHGLSVKSFRRWRRRRKVEAAQANATLTLVPVKQSNPSPCRLVQLHSPGGWRIELAAVDASWLGGLLHQLP